MFSINDIVPENNDEEKMYELIDKNERVIFLGVFYEHRKKLSKYCIDEKKIFYFVPEIEEIIYMNCDTKNLLDTPLKRYSMHNQKFGYLFIKRMADITFSLLLILILWPIMLIAAISIKIEDHGPTVSDDPRILKTGKFYRKCRIDELPQLFNILKGDMSFVGPRPERIEHVEKYEADLPEFKYRHMVRGGLTGYAQVYGKYNTSAEDKLKLDLLYIMNANIFMDVKMVMLTIKTIFQKESTEGFES